MAIRRPSYKTLEALLAAELVLDEDEETASLIRSLRHVKRVKVLTKQELLSICRWKSPRALRLVESNHPMTIRSLTRKALLTPSEQLRVAYLTELRGVSFPMASAILTLIDPNRYGVIDIRVWQLLFALGSVTKNAKGVGFNFKHWYQYLCKLRHHAKQCGVSVRAVERSLFLFHQRYQEGRLYEG